MNFLQRFRDFSTYPLLLRFVDLNLAGAVMLLSLVMGGRHPWGYLLLVTLAICASIGWLLHLTNGKQVTWVRSPLRIVLGAAICLLLVQVIPLPSGIQNWLSPNIQNLLPLSNSEVPGNCLPRWSQLSFMPAATTQGLVVLLAYVLLFYTTVQRVQEISDVERLLKYVGAAAITMATFGLLQYLLSNGCFFWFYEHPYRDTNDVVKGAFINRNHFAHFLALGIPPLIWWLVRLSNANREGTSNTKFRTRRKHSAFPLWLWLGFGIVWLAGLLSLSRGGITAMLIAAIASAILLKRVTQFNARLTWSMIGLGVLVIVALAVHGAQGVLNRFDEVTSGSIEKLDRSSGRRQIWLADWQAVKEFSLVGTGVGSHAAVYPTFFPKSSDELEYTHAESGYLQVALETGVVGLILAFSAIGVISSWCWRVFRESESTRLVSCLAATTASLIVSGLHSFVDFVWFIPGCMATTVVLAACTYRLWLLSGAEARIAKYTSRISIGQCRLATVSVCALGIWMLVISIGPALAAPAWDRYLRLSTAVLKTDLHAADEAIKDNRPAGDAASELSRRKDALQAMISELQSVVRYDSSHVLARVHLAAARLQWFELLQQDAPLPMPLSAVRDAALESHFKSRAELDAWLQRAVGPHYSQLEAARREVRQALALCPLYGEAYLYLSDLCFLEGAQQTTKSQFLAQALAVRPYDGEVHFEAGKECFLQNQTQAAVDHWRLAFHSGQEFKTRLIDLFTGNLAGQVPVSFFLENFQPDLVGLRQLRQRYQQLTLVEDRTALWRYSADQLTSAAAQSQATAACALWLEAEPLYRDLGDTANRVNCVQQALAADSANYSAHYAAVNCFHDVKDYSNTEEQAKWCLTRAPNDANLKRIRDEVVKARVSSGTDQRSVQVTQLAQPATTSSSNSQAFNDASINR